MEGSLEVGLQLVGWCEVCRCVEVCGGAEVGVGLPVHEVALHDDVHVSLALAHMLMGTWRAWCGEAGAACGIGGRCVGGCGRMECRGHGLGLDRMGVAWCGWDL